jgi:glycosyltransferase involved in cell wall biosynthesis
VSEMDLISLIIPTKNRLKLLLQTLDNVFKQSYSNLEVIVVDDGSSDGTFEFLKKNYDTRLLIIKNSGRGPGASRNAGIAVASGKYVKFFDSDDLMSPNTIAVQHHLLSRSSSGFIYSPYLFAKELDSGYWEATGNSILNYHPFNSEKSLNHWMLRGLFIAVPSMLFKRELLRQVGSWSEETVAYEDWEYLWRVGLNEPRPIHTSETLFLYRQHGEQTTLNNSNDVFRDREAILMFERISKNSDSYFKSTVDKLWMKSKMYKIVKKNSAEPFFKDRIARFNRASLEIFLAYTRVYYKVERFKSGTDWPSFYGPEKSAEKILNHISAFNALK